MYSSAQSHFPTNKLYTHDQLLKSGNTSITGSTTSFACYHEQENRYRVFIDLKDTRGREKITHLTEILRADANDPYGKSVESLQHVHSHEIKLLQVCDLLLGAICFARRPVAAHESPAKRQLVRYIEDRIGYPLTSDSPPGEEKCSIITWHDPDALLI